MKVARPGWPPARINGRTNPEYVRMYQALPGKLAERLAYNRKWRKPNPDRARAAMVKHKYGLTADDVRAMLEAQGHACAICRKPFGDKREHVDHDHETGRVRGLLCGPCNRALPHVERDHFREPALAYLRGHRDN